MLKGFTVYMLILDPGRVDESSYYYNYLHFGDEKPDAQRSKNFVQWSTEGLASVCTDWITWQ